jgi:hypothetical protein
VFTLYLRPNLFGLRDSNESLKGANERNLKRENETKNRKSKMIAFTNPFHSARELFSAFGIVRRDLDSWRLTEATPGQIHGLNSSHGILLATNGMLCVIERQTPNEAAETPKIFFGHLDYFEPYKGTTTVNALSSGGDKDGDHDIVYKVGSKAREAKAAQRAKELVSLLESL